ncbi:hypothetical protein COP2_038747 [Malus domestica]
MLKHSSFSNNSPICMPRLLMSTKSWVFVHLVSQPMLMFRTKPIIPITLLHAPIDPLILSGMVVVVMVVAVAPFGVIHPTHHHVMAYAHCPTATFTGFHVPCYSLDSNSCMTLVPPSHD